MGSHELLATVLDSQHVSHDAEQLVPPAVQAQSEVDAWSADIDDGIHRTSVKVQELRQMVPKPDIFDDRASQIDRLSCNIKEDLQMLAQKLAAFEARVVGRGPHSSYQVQTRNVLTTLAT